MSDPKTGKARTRLYAYGVSLGANILGLYLGRGSEHAKKCLDGVCLFSTPWSTKDGSSFFYSNFYGLYQKIIGLNLNSLIKKK